MTNIVRGAIQRTGPAYDNMITGTLTVSGYPPQPLVTDRTPIVEVIIQATPLEQNAARVGTGDGQYFVLAAGDNVTIKINDLSRVFIGLVVNPVTVNWIAYI